MTNSSEYLEKVKSIATWIDEKKGTDLVAFDVSKLASFTDAMIIATVANVRQAKSVADYILEKLKDHGWELLGVEGYQNSNWVLIDCNDVLVHLFLADERSFIDLEGLWSEAESIGVG